MDVGSVSVGDGRGGIYKYKICARISVKYEMSEYRIYIGRANFFLYLNVCFLSVSCIIFKCNNSKHESPHYN